MFSKPIYNNQRVFTMTTVKELYDELTYAYNKQFNSGITSGKIIEHVKRYNSIVPLICVHADFHLSGNKCSLVYLHTVLESRFICFEEEGRTYVDFSQPIGIESWI